MVEQTMMTFHHFRLFQHSGWIAVLLGSVLAVSTLGDQWHEAVIESSGCDGALQFWPTISSLTSAKPARYFWRFGISLMMLSRPWNILLYFTRHRRHLTNSVDRLWAPQIAVALGFLELFSLMLLSFVGSSETYHVHEKGFMGFGVFSIANMITLLVAESRARRAAATKPNRINAFNELSYRLKIAFFACYVVSLGLCPYFFYRSAVYCEDYIYSFFAVAEWIAVVFCILFHATALIDFPSNMQLSIHLPIEIKDE
jgi:Frag1/DRAM/Sfk1 family